MTKLKKKEEKLREEEARSSAQRIAHSQVQAECESLRETRQKLEDRVEEMKTRMGEVILKAADLRKVNNDLKDSISKSDEIIANLKIELSMAKHRAQVMEQRSSEGEARDRNVLIEQAGILSRKLEEEAAARVSLEYSVTRLQSSTNALKEEHRARVDELEFRSAMLEMELNNFRQQSADGGAESRLQSTLYETAGK